MGEMVLSVAQASPVTNDIPANTELAAELLQKANRMGADLVVFPELFLCGYNMEAIAARPDLAAVTVECPQIEYLRKVCRKLSVFAVIGLCLKVKDGLLNAAIIIDDAGKVVDVYGKANLWWEDEQKVFQAGNRLVLFDVRGFKIGMGICYDAAFPEHSRKLVRLGADVILYPSAFCEGDQEHRYHMYYPMRALENTVYVAVSNLTGEENDARFFGKSAIIGPTGHTLVHAGSKLEVISTKISHESILSTRRGLPYLKDLRLDLYQNTPPGLKQV